MSVTFLLMAVVCLFRTLFGIVHSHNLVLFFCFSHFRPAGTTCAVRVLQALHRSVAGISTAGSPDYYKHHASCWMAVAA